ncbi:MAG: carbohydrate kinase family protein [Clostridiales bacterium]|nr:carbohydrate kinase family protein [Clostridiales bacterium]
MKKYDVLSVGDINIEITMAGLNSMPVLGREILASSLVNTLGGSTVNCAVGMSKLGLESAFVGKVGRDSNGEFLISELEKLGVDASHVVFADVPTGITVSMNMSGDRAMTTYLGAIDELCGDDVPDELLRNSRHLHIGSFFLQNKLRRDMASLFERAKKLGLTTSLDAGWDDTGCWDYGLRDVLKHVDIFFPNESEAQMITGMDTVEEAAEALSKICSIAAVKWGKNGAYVQFGDFVVTHKAYRCTPVDTTGAGDCFNAGFLTAFIEGKPLEECIDYGLAAGSISITRMGSATSCPNREEVLAMIRDDIREE